MFDAWWVLIPITAILAGALKDWVKIRAQQRVLGASTKDLEQDVATLQKENNALNERLKNLEAIVVSQTWDVLHDKSLPPADRERQVATVAHREFAPEPGPTDAQRAAQLARRLGG
ncbi:MAG TPA: hypothetical protein VJ725_03745 [Thermoanaerobaculia bacterium]|nr:hypothetical protein [Thermoanaerobaculia bacterium]